MDEDRRKRRKNAVERYNQKKNHNLADRNPIQFTANEIRTYINPLKRAGYIINTKLRTIDGSKVSKNNQRTVKGEYFWLVSTKGFRDE